MDKLVFKAEAGAMYRVLFGNSEAVKPSYDIEQFKSSVEKEKQELCSLAALQKNPQYKEKQAKTSEDGADKAFIKLVLNITVVVISLFLIFIIVRKLNIRA